MPRLAVSFNWKSSAKLLKLIRRKLHKTCSKYLSGFIGAQSPTNSNRPASELEFSNHSVINKHLPSPCCIKWYISGLTTKMNNKKKHFLFDTVQAMLFIRFHGTEMGIHYYELHTNNLPKCGSEGKFTEEAWVLKHCVAACMHLHFGDTLI